HLLMLIHYIKCVLWLVCRTKNYIICKFIITYYIVFSWIWISNTSIYSIKSVTGDLITSDFLTLFVIINISYLRRLWSSIIVNLVADYPSLNVRVSISLRDFST